MTVVAARRVPSLGVEPLPPEPFDPPNPIYAAVERVLAFGGWPRLEGVVRRGDRVIVKPNFVTDRYYHERLQDRRLLASSTHASVIRPLVDFALERGAAEVLVADCPIEGCDLAAVAAGLGVTPMIDALRVRGHPVRFLDLRPFRIVPVMPLDDARFAGRSWNIGALARRPLPGDPEGYAPVDLGSASRFADVEYRSALLRFHRANPRTPVAHHSDGRHEYGMPRSVLNADVIIHVPKLKTHKKSGVTIALKSAIGLCGFKYWLPHYTEGSPPQGDEFPSTPSATERLAIRLSRLPLPHGHSIVLRAPRIGSQPSITEGSWEGNDTIWRTTLDLARILVHGDSNGRIQSEPIRRSFTLVDGLVAGEGEGPFGVQPLALGLLIAGENPVLVDSVGARAMGFDPALIPTIARGLEAPLLTSNFQSVEERWDGPEGDRAFIPPRSWRSLLPIDSRIDPASHETGSLAADEWAG
jgi:uncharacterized protein (DUF362 family)